MVNIDNFILNTDTNTFKNSGNNTGTLTIPTYIAAGSIYTDTISFTLESESTPHFHNTFVYATDYSDNFDYFPSLIYRDRWCDARFLSLGVLITSSDAGVLNASILVKSTSNGVSITFRLSRKGTTAATITHSSYVIPVSMIDFNLAN